MKIFTVAEVPDELGQAWLQHLRNFDTANSGCHFQVLSEAPDLSTEIIVEMLRSLTPPLPNVRVIGTPDEEWEKQPFDE